MLVKYKYKIDYTTMIDAIFVWSNAAQTITPPLLFLVCFRTILSRMQSITSDQWMYSGNRRTSTFRGATEVVAKNLNPDDTSAVWRYRAARGLQPQLLQCWPYIKQPFSSFQ
jgi:hypothetical protein